MDKNQRIFVIAVLIIIAAGIIIFSTNKGQNNKETNNQNQMKNEILADGLQIIDEVVGTGAEAKNGDTVSVNYVGTLTDGKKFDSSYDRNQSFSFVLGAGKVIKGWDEGVAGMRVGGKRKLVIPPALAYGSQDIGNGLIPPNSTLVFEVELLEVR
jgi:FKBP-type peptidyl-prolyl cis-trans isomerase